MKKYNAISLSGMLLMCLVVAMVNYFLSFLQVGALENAGLETMAISVLLGIFLFIVILMLVRQLSSLGIGDYTQEENKGTLEALTIAVDDDRNVYLLPRNHSKITLVQFQDNGANIEVMNSLFTRDIKAMRSITVEASVNGEISLSHPGSADGVSITSKGEIWKQGTPITGEIKNIH